MCTENLSVHHELSLRIVVGQDTFLSEFLFRHSILGAHGLDRFLWQTIPVEDLCYLRCVVDRSGNRFDRVSTCVIVERNVYQGRVRSQWGGLFSEVLSEEGRDQLAIIEAMRLA